MNLTGMLAGFMRGQGDKAAYQRERAVKEPQEKLAQQLLKLQMQQAQQKLQQQKITQQLLSAYLPILQAKQGGEAGAPAAGGSPAFNGQVEKAKGAVSGQGLTDQISSMDPLIATLLKSASGIDFPGAFNETEDRRHNKALETTSTGRLEQQTRANDIREKSEMRAANATVPVTVTGPSGSQQRISVPKFAEPGTTIQTSPGVKELPIAEANLPLWVKPDDLSTPPVGMTPTEATKKGYRRLSTTQKSVVMSIGAVDGILSDIESLMKSVFPESENLLQRAVGATKRKVGAATQTNRDAALLDSKIMGVLAPVIRALGEKGALANEDVERAANLFPKLTDDADVAWAKLRELKGMFKRAKDQNMGSIEPDMVYNPKTVGWNP
jgi:hypothetical protein